MHSPTVKKTNMKATLVLTLALVNSLDNRHLVSLDHRNQFSWNNCLIFEQVNLQEEMCFMEEDWWKVFET